MNEIQTPAFARAIERMIFGALLGMLATTALIRFILLIIDFPTIVLIGLSAIGVIIGSILGLYSTRPQQTMSGKLDRWHSWLGKIGLKAMLGLLGVAALLGVVTVLTGSYEVLGRVSGTVVATSIAAGFLWGSSVLASRTVTREAGLLGMASTLAVYMLVIPFIWDLGLRGEETLSTSLVIGLCTPVLMFFLTLKAGAETWYASRIGFLLQLLAVGSFLVAAWHGASWRAAEPWWETGWWTTLLAFICFACLCGLKRISLNWRWLGVVACLITWTLIMIQTWAQNPLNEKLIVFVSSIALTFAHASLVRLAPLNRYQHWLSWLTIGSAISASIFINLEINLQPGNGLSLLGRTGAACLVVVACGSLALIVISTLNRFSSSSKKLEHDGLRAEFGSISLTCPQCKHVIETPIGKIVCPGCQLQMSLRIEALPNTKPTPQSTLTLPD